MNYSAIYVKPVKCDWPSNQYGEDWEPILPTFDGFDIDDFKRWLDATGHPHPHVAEAADFTEDDWLVWCMSEAEKSGYCPMMNYYYPLPEFDGDAGKAQAQLDLLSIPVCLVEVNGEYALALTGGGMDLTDKIIRAYVALGYAPPLELCGVPETVDAETVGACIESVARVILESHGLLERLNKLHTRLMAQ